MKHKMKLQEPPFERIRNGTKVIEVRLNDEKRQKLNVGDEIEFALADNPEQKIHTEVLELFHFPSFKELLEAFPPKMYGGGGYKKMYKHYSRKDEKRYKVLGIKLRYLGEI